jgi:hypothetical protein
MQQKHVMDMQAQLSKLTAQLLVSVGLQIAAKEAAQVLGAKVHFQGLFGFERKCQDCHATQRPASRARPALCMFDNRFALALDNRFLTGGAIRLAGNTIPSEGGFAAAATGSPQGKAALRGHPHAVHELYSRDWKGRKRRALAQSWCSGFSGDIDRFQDAVEGNWRFGHIAGRQPNGRAEFFSQEAFMNQSSFRRSSLLSFASICLVLAAVACIALTTRGGAVASQNESHVKLTATAGKIDKDGRQTITIKMRVNDDWHAYANPVKNEDLEPNQTVVKVTSAKKLEDVSVVYPEGHRQMSGKESYQVYEGNVEILASVKRVAGDTGPLQVTVQYVTCNDKKGLCLPPESVKLEVK